jgi:nucleotide-binding universal stress UspA family protein
MQNLEVKRILVPVDFSPNSLSALRFSVNLALQINAEITLFHAYNLDENMDDDAPLNYVRTLNKDLLQITLQKLKNLSEPYLNTGLLFHYSASSGNITDIIEKVVISTQSQLIVMGTRGVNVIKKTGFGSNTAKIIEKSIVPVLAIPERFNFTGFNKCLYATNYNYSDIRGIAFLSNLVNPYSGSVILVHVTDQSKEEAENEMRKFKSSVEKNISYPGIEYKIVYRKDIVDSLDFISRTVSADVLSMTSMKRTGFFARLFDESLTQNMALYSTVPLLAFTKQIS